MSSKLPAGQIANTPYAKLLSNLSKHQRSSPSPDPSRYLGLYSSASSMQHLSLTHLLVLTGPLSRAMDPSLIPMDEAGEYLCVMPWRIQSTLSRSLVYLQVL